MPETKREVPRDLVKQLYTIGMRTNDDSPYAGYDPGEAADWTIDALYRLGYIESVRDMDAETVYEMADEKSKTAEQTEQADKGWLQTKYSQAEVGYTDYAVRRNPVNSVCQTCRWFINRDFSRDGASNCHIVECYPLDIVGTGYCNQWTARKIVEPEPMAVVLVEESDDMDSEELEVGAMARGGIVDKSRPIIAGGDNIVETINYGVPLKVPAAIKRAQDAIRDVLKRARPDDDPMPAFKMLSDDLARVIFTNNFQDRDGEIISGKALDDMFDRMQSGYVPYPEFWHAHIPGTKHGQALWADKAGDHLGYAIIKFDSTPAAREAVKTYKRLPRGSFTLSHGFTFPTYARKEVEINGEKVAVYEVLNTFEISSLLPGQEANPYTSFATLEEISDMPMTEEKKAQIRALFGKQADTILTEVEQMEVAGKALAEVNTRYKEYVDLSPTDTAEKSQADTASGELLSEMLIVQGEATKALMGLEGFTKAVEKAAADKTAALENRVKALEALLEMKATPASEAASTVVTPTNGVTEEALKAALAAIQQKNTGGNTDTVESIIFGGK